MIITISPDFWLLRYIRFINIHNNAARKGILGYMCHHLQILHQKVLIRTKLWNISVDSDNTLPFAARSTLPTSNIDFRPKWAGLSLPISLIILARYWKSTKGWTAINLFIMKRRSTANQREVSHPNATVVKIADPLQSSLYFVYSQQSLKFMELA